jgi:hypothetical protein
MKIAFITCKKEKLGFYFPTEAEPDLLPIELPLTPDDQIVVNALRNKGALVDHITWGERDLNKLKTYDLLIMH